MTNDIYGEAGAEARKQDKANHSAPRKAARSIAGLARIATVIAAAAALAPAEAQAVVGGDFGQSIKPAHKGKAHKAPQAPARGGNAAGTENADIVPASLGGMGRGGMPLGVYTASPNVTTSCFRPRLIGLLATIQHKYHRPVIITSGYRGAVHNIRAGGVRGSLHVACAAADIKVPGVNKFQLASYVRSLPNRGGVGLYCHNAVHVDVGTPREWNWCATRRR